MKNSLLASSDSRNNNNNNDEEESADCVQCPETLPSLLTQQTLPFIFFKTLICILFSKC